MKSQHIIALQSLINIATHPKATKAEIRQIAEESRRALALPDPLGALQAAVSYLSANPPKGKIREIFSLLNEHENAVLKPARAVIAAHTPAPLAALRHHVTGAIERGEAEAIVEEPTAAAILARLAHAAPSIHIQTVWDPDDECEWDVEDPDLDPEDFQAWQSEVRATACVGGQLYSGSAYLGGTWEKYGDNPEKSNPEISGYFPQMAGDAIRELRDKLEALEGPFNHSQIQRTITEINSALANL